MYDRAAPELVVSSDQHYVILQTLYSNLQKLLYSFFGWNSDEFGGTAFVLRPGKQDSCMPDQGQLLPAEHLPVVGPFASESAKCPAEGAESALPV